ncbi:MAG: hypothetical protein LAO76_01065 [Acidobacteriia bacterium]|nr:hypothetical protein [Terriglobia bacterium]
MNGTKLKPEKEMSGFVQICIFLFIALSPIQDFFLQGTPLRSLGASPSLFPLLAIAVVSFTQWLIYGNLNVDRALLVCLVYVFLTTAYGFLYFGLTSHDQNMIWKSTTSFISLALLVFAVSNIEYRINSVVRAGIYTAFGLVILGFCFSNANPFGLPGLLETRILHFTPVADFRPRGLSSEPSEFSISAITMGLLGVHLTRSTIARIILFAVTAGLLVASGSKGGMLTLFFCAVVLCLIKWHSRWYHIVGILLILLPFGALFILMVVPNLFPEEVIATSGTIPTRFSMILCALITVTRHPLGVGLSGFLPAVGAYLPSAMSTVQSFFAIPLYFEEVSQYQTSADMVSTKTFFFDQLIRFGIPFAFWFLIFIVRLLNRLVAQRQWIIAIALMASAIAVTTYIPTAGVYTVAIVFGVGLSEVRNATNISRGK